MNVVCLLGRLTADPELRHTQSDIPVARFSLAVDRGYVSKGQEQRQTDFINLVAWRQTAEFVSKYFHKGQRMAVQGSLRQNSFTDKEGNKRTTYEVVADNVFFAESKQNSGSSTGSYDSQVPTYNEAPTAFSTAKDNDFVEIVGDDELPF